MPTGYLYIEVPFDKVRQQDPVFTIFASPEPYVSIEAFAKGRGISNVYRRDLVDLSRVYRFPNTALWHFTKDKCNPGQRYLLVGNERFPVHSTDPSVGKTPTRPYTPV